MNIEQRLESMDNSLKLLVTIMQSAGVMTAAAAEVTTPAPAPAPADGKPKTTRKPKDEPAKVDVVDGDAEGTRYWVSDSLAQVYAQKPGDPDPEDQTFKIESSAHYLAKKAEFAKNASAAAAASPATAGSDPSVTAQVAGASEVTFKQVTDSILELSKHTGPNGGRDGVLAVLKQFGCEGKKVPDLGGLNKNAEILAFVKAQMAPADAGMSDLGI
jgi:hypothetical protein